MFVSDQILLQFNPDQDMVVETDFSGYVVGESLMQYNNDGFLRPCTFFLRKNLPAECNYEIYDKKLLVII